MVKENYRCKENYWGLVVRQSGARPVIFCVSKKLSEKLRTMNRALEEINWRLGLINCVILIILGCVLYRSIAASTDLSSIIV